MIRFLLALTTAALLGGCAVHATDDFGQPGPRIQAARSVGLPPAHSWRWQTVPMEGSLATEGLDARGEAFWIRVARSYRGPSDWTIFGPLKPGQRVDLASALGREEPYEVGVQEMVHGAAPQPALPRASIHEAPLPVRIAVPGVVIGRLPTLKVQETLAVAAPAAPAAPSPAAGEVAASPEKAQEPARPTIEPAPDRAAAVSPASAGSSTPAASASPVPNNAATDHSEAGEAKRKAESPKPEVVAATFAAGAPAVPAAHAADAPINAGVEIDPQRLPGETNCVDPVRAYNREPFPVVVSWRTRAWQSGATRLGVCKLSKTGPEESIVLRPAHEPGSVQRLFCGRVQGASYTCVDHRSAEDVKAERAPTPASRLPVAAAGR